MIPITDLAIFLAVLTVLNVVVFTIFASDKDAARKNANRTSERTLIFLALFGPFGAYGAMKIFRHKTQKIRFYLVPVFLLLHLAGLYMGS
jgi:uncharacterized membrane protein YsdA (DUF1294 family)